MEAIIKECERLAQCGKFSRAAGGIMVIQKLSDDKEVAANPVSLTIDQVRRVSSLAHTCKQKQNEADRATIKPKKPVTKKRIPVTTIRNSLHDAFAHG